MRVGQFQMYTGWDEDTQKDETFWAKEPDQIYHVPAMGPANRNWGVNVVPMWNWFDDFQSNDGKYVMISGRKSCSGVALMALKAGGGEAFVSSPGNSIFVLPKEVAAWALRLQVAIADFNRESMRFEMDSVAALDRLGGYKAQQIDFSKPRMSGVLDAPDLWKHNEWLGQSHETGRMRTGEIHKIDLAISTYHTFDFRQKYAEKFKLLVHIFRECVSYTKRYGEGRRNFVVVALGKRCLNVMRGAARDVM